jgi:hypothetical protein
MEIVAFVIGTTVIGCIITGVTIIYKKIEYSYSGRIKDIDVYSYLDDIENIKFKQD